MTSTWTSTDSVTGALLSALVSLRSTPPRIIQSPATQPRRASVALIIRLKPPPDLEIPEEEYGIGATIEEFFQLPWVSHPLTTPQLLYIRRPSRPNPDNKSSTEAHLAFPGGRHDPNIDDTANYTALRETWEEIGIDLAEKEYLCVGRLDDREITTSLGKRLLMILSPFVFLQRSPLSPEPDLQPSEVSSLHYIPLPLLTPPYAPSQWSHVSIDISSRLSPRNRLVRLILRGLVGNMKFAALLLPDEPEAVAEGFIPEWEDEWRGRKGNGWLGDGWRDGRNGKRLLRLWGLTLGMTLDLLAHLPQANQTPLLQPTPLLPSSSTTSTPDPIVASPNPITAANSKFPISEPRTPVTVTSSFDFNDPKSKSQSSGATTTSGVSANDAAAERRLRADSRETDVVIVGGDGGTGEVNGAKVDIKVDGGGKGKGKERDLGLGVGTVDVNVNGNGNAIKIEGLEIGRKRNKSPRRGIGPGMTVVFPKFSYPDVNFWIWVFGRRYRAIVRKWESSMTGPVKASDRRVNWSGAALSSFYSAVRQALIVAILLRAVATTAGLAGLAWWVWRKWYAV